MRLEKIIQRTVTLLLVLSLLATAVLAYNGVCTDSDGNIGYQPYEQGIYSKGGYTLKKISHPTLGAGQVDGILTGEEQDRGQSYSWSMVEAGDYVYIGTCYNSTYYIYHNNVVTTLRKMQTNGLLDPKLDAVKLADEIVQVAFGVDRFDSSLINEWSPVIMAVSKKTGEARVIFRERDVWSQYPDIFPGFSPLLPVKNYLSGYRMAFEFKGKLYFAGMGNPTATLVEIDPSTNEAKIVYHNTNVTRGVSNGVHGLLVYDGEILMCLATDNYDGKGTPGGIIVASSDPGASLDSWRVIADQDDFEGLPAVLQIDGLNGGGVWDIIAYNGYLYVTVVTDKTDPTTGETNKQGFAMYRGEKQKNNSFTWTQVIGDHSKYGFGLGINYSMACNLWVYDDHLYLGTYNDPMLDLAAVPATGNFEHLYNDLDHSIYLYRMDQDENFEQIGGRNDNPCFPEGPKGNLGAGLGNHSNQYVWRFGVHDDELYIGTYDTSTLTYIFTQLTDGQVKNMEYEDISGRAEVLEDALLQVLNQKQDPYLELFLKKTLFSDGAMELLQKLSGYATGLSTDWNPVPDYRNDLAKYEAFKAKVYKLLEDAMSQSSFEADYRAAAASAPNTPSAYSVNGVGENASAESLKSFLRGKLEELFGACDTVFYDKTIHNFVYYFGVNYYAQQCECGFDLLVSKDGVHFDAITRDGFGDQYNHGLRTICSTENGVYMGTANPFYGTQLWLLSTKEDGGGSEGGSDTPCDGTGSCPSKAFSDLDTSLWYHEGIDFVLNRGFMKGMSSTVFAPDGLLTRAQMVTILYRMAGSPKVADRTPFTDVEAGSFYADALVWGYEIGVVKGMSATMFAPNVSVTREQLVTFLYRYAQLSGAVTENEGSLSAFPDADQVSGYAVEAMTWSVSQGLVNGMDGKLAPKSTATRAQIAAMIQRYYENN